MSHCISVAVKKKSNPLNAKRREYLMEIFPAWRNIAPGQPGFTDMTTFERRSIQLHTRAVDAQVSISGAPWCEEDLDTLKSRDPRKFLKVISCPHNLQRLLNDFDKELYRQGVVN